LGFWSCSKKKSCSLCPQLSTCKIWQSLEIRKVTNSSFKYQEFENIIKFELGSGPLVSHGCHLTGHCVSTRGHVVVARPPPTTSQWCCRPIAATCRLRARLTPLPYPFPCWAGRSKLLSRHLAPWPPLFLVPPLHHRLAITPSGRATTRKPSTHACFIYMSVVVLKPRPKHVVVDENSTLPICIVWAINLNLWFFRINWDQIRPHSQNIKCSPLLVLQVCKASKILDLGKYLFQVTKQSSMNRFLDMAVSEFLLNWLAIFVMYISSNIGS
jgi:hypothetical protein